MWSQLYAQFQAMNCRCNSLAFVCLHAFGSGGNVANGFLHEMR